MATEDKVSPQAQDLYISGILNQCHNVPDNINAILKPIAHRKLRLLVNAMRNIDYTPCGFFHEKTGDDFVACTDRRSSAGCGHVGHPGLTYARIDAEINQIKFDSVGGPAIHNPNNAVATLTYAASLLLALGTHNDEASAIIEHLNTHVYEMDKLDRYAAQFYEKMRCYPSNDSYASEEQQLHRQQDAKAQHILQIRDRLSVILAEGMDKFLDPSLPKQPSGSFQVATGVIRGRRVPAWSI